MVYTAASRRYYYKRVVAPFVIVYVLHLVCPQEAHFRRYIAERKRLDVDFAQRVEHPQAKISFANYFIFSRGVIESCGFRGRPTGPVIDNGISRWTYYGICNNLFFEKRVF